MERKEGEEYLAMQIGRLAKWLDTGCREERRVRMTHFFLFGEIRRMMVPFIASALHTLLSRIFLPVFKMSLKIVPQD